MSRSFSAQALAALYAAETSALFPILCIISHPQFDDSWYIVNNTEAITYDGHIYQPYPFKFTPPSQGESQGNEATFTIDEIDTTIAETIKAVSSAYPLTITLVAAMVQGADAPEALIPWTFTLKKFSSNGTVLTGTLSLDDVLDNQMGPIEFTPNLFPGVF